MVPDVPQTRAERRSGSTHLMPEEEEEAPWLLVPSSSKPVRWLFLPAHLHAKRKAEVRERGSREDEARGGDALTGRKEDDMDTGY